MRLVLPVMVAAALDIEGCDKPEEAAGTKGNGASPDAEFGGECTTRQSSAHSCDFLISLLLTKSGVVFFLFTSLG